MAIFRCFICDYIEGEVRPFFTRTKNYLKLFETLKIKIMISKRQTKNPAWFDLI